METSGAALAHLLGERWSACPSGGRAPRGVRDLSEAWGRIGLFLKMFSFRIALCALMEITAVAGEGELAVPRHGTDRPFTLEFTHLRVLVECLRCAGHGAVWSFYIRG